MNSSANTTVQDNSANRETELLHLVRLQLVVIYIFPQISCAQIQKSTQIQIDMPTQIQIQYLAQIQMQHITNLTQLRVCNRCTGCTGQVIDLQLDFHQPQTAAAAAANTR